MFLPRIRGDLKVSDRKKPGKSHVGPKHYVMPKALNPCGIGAQLSPTLQGGTMVVALVNGGPSQVSQKTVCRCWLRCLPSLLFVDV